MVTWMKEMIDIFDTRDSPRALAATWMAWHRAAEIKEEFRRTAVTAFARCWRWLYALRPRLLRVLFIVVLFDGTWCKIAQPTDV